jgi:hypothetical protein
LSYFAPLIKKGKQGKAGSGFANAGTLLFYLYRIFLKSVDD